MFNKKNQSIMKKFLSLIAAVLFAGSMMAEEATMTAGTNGSACTVNDVAGIKCGTSKAGGDMTITVGAGATKLSFYAAAWKGVTDLSLNLAADGVTFSPASVSLTADDGISNNTPFTLVGSAEAFKFEVELTGVTAETTIAVTSSAAKRFVVWGASYETGEVPPTPADTYTVAGSDAAIFGTSWDVTNTANDMVKANGIYKWEKAELNLAVGDIEFKVAKNHSWDIAYPAQNYVLNIAEAGEYTLTITFDPSTETVAAEAVKKVIPQYEVAEAIAAGLADDTEIEVRGVVTKIQIKGKNFANFGSACIYVKDATGAEGEFEFYNCYSFDAAKFTSTVPAYDETSTAWADLKKVADANGNEVRLGDTIVAFGKYKLYNTTHELNTGCYIVDIKHAPVEPGQTIEVNMSKGLRFVDYVAAEGWWELYGDDGKYIIDLSNVSTEQIAGEYPIDNLDPDYRYLGIINGEDTTYVNFVDGAITLTVSENGDVTVTGTLVGDDDNSYVLNLAYVVPTPQETVNVNIQDGELDDEYAEAGLYVVYGEDANEVYVQLAIWAENGFEGAFTEADLDLQYIGSFIYDGEEYVEIYSATIAVTPADGGGYNIVATILGYNNKQYTIAMTIPAQEEGIEETLAAGKAAKVLRDGQVLILKGDKTFNVMGTVVR